jgi:hypothetical protein
VARFLLWAIAAAFRPRARLIAENLYLRQQLLVLQRRRPQSPLRNAHRRFWICASRWFSGWRNSLLVVKPETVLKWHRRGWRAYFSWRSRRRRCSSGRRPIAQELQALIRRMAAENRLWGQKRIQAELARLGFKLSTRTVAKYMRARRNGGPSPGWRKFLKEHAPNIWACDFFCIHTILFQTLYVFFVIRLANREVLHVEVTRHPTAEWAAQSPQPKLQVRDDPPAISAYGYRKSLPEMSIFPINYASLDDPFAESLRQTWNLCAWAPRTAKCQSEAARCG